MFVFSPLVGTPLTTSAKFAVVAKSPLTGRLTDALASSHFAIAGKLTGHDAIVLRGACDEPSVVVIDRGEIHVEPAHDLWGLPAAEAEHASRAKRSGMPRRGDRSRRGARRALRDDLARRSPRRPGRARRGDGIEAVQGDPRARRHQGGVG